MVRGAGVVPGVPPRPPLIVSFVSVWVVALVALPSPNPYFYPPRPIPLLPGASASPTPYRHPSPPRAMPHAPPL